MAFAPSHAGLLSRILTALTVLALTVRFAIPAGTMLQKPVEEGDLPALVICSSAGMITIKVDGYGIPAKPEPSRHQDNGKSGEPCVFAAMAAVAAAPAPIVLDVPAPVATPAPFWAAVQQRPGEGLAAPPPPATGPPSLV